MERVGDIQHSLRAAPAPGAAPEQNVRRRKVFYISGFDPRRPSYYHGLYEAEAQKQTRLNGLSVQVGSIQRKEPIALSWPIRSSLGTARVETDYELLRWDDIMRKRMRRTGPKFYWDILRTYWLYIHTGALWRILKTSYPAFFAGVYPVVLLACIWALSAMTAFAAFANAPRSIPPPATAIASAFLFVCVFWLLRKIETKIPISWPLYMYSFAADHMRGRVPDMDERIRLISREIVDYVTISEDDEVLIASHSNGAVVAILAIAAALRADPALAGRGPKLSFLTLGHSIPLCSFLPQAEDLRQGLADLGSDNGIDWVDISAPRDAACFAVTDPLLASGLKAANRAEPKPKLLSLALADLFSPETFRKTLLHRWLRIHFQYLMAYERPTPFDYFMITAGPLTLAKRFEDFPSKKGFAKFQLFQHLSK